MLPPALLRGLAPHTTVASISNPGGVITGLSGGTTTISYTVTSSGCSATSVVTVNPRPSIITGDSTVCHNATITVFDSTTGGSWSMVSGTPHLTINGIGVVGGLEAATVTGNSISGGTNLITYTSSAGCTRTKQITVNPLPTISGTLNICQGNTTTLTGAPTGGTWLSTAGAVGTIGATSGVAGGVTNGTTLISYTDLRGCINTATLTVNPLPLPITGTFTVCVGSTTSLASATGGGAWSSSGSASVSTSGVVTGTSVGTAVITYMNPSTLCFVTQVVTVSAVPGPITGTLQLCAGGNTTTLTNGTSGGTWSSSGSSVATIGASDGAVVSGIAGTTTISYILSSGCSTTAIFTTNPLPTGITGSLTTCANSTTTLTGAPTPGSFSSSASSSIIASISSSGVVVAGPSTGTGTITYSLPTGCFITAVVTVTAAAPPITGATFNVCVNDCIALSQINPGGTWSSSNVAVGTVNASGLVCGVAGGTTNITYTEPGGCIAVATVTVTALPAAITGPGSVCIGSTITLANSTPGGTWQSSLPGTGTVGASNGVVGGVATGVTTITYSLTAVANCFITKPVSVNAAPAAISVTPSDSVCVGSTVTMSSFPTGGVWSTATPGIASVNPSTGVVTGVSTAGGGVGTITYTVSGCSTTRTVTVFPTPTILGAPYVVCPGTTLSLAGIPTGGTWTGINGTGTVIVFGSGAVAGVADGTATVIYHSPAGCSASVVVTVNPLPAPIVASSTNICVAGTATLTNTVSGGSWISGAPGTASVTPTTGIVTGVSAGTVNITYQLTATGCYSWITLTVDPLLPAITGPNHVCIGSSATLSNATTGGTWTSSTTAATIDPSTGVVTGSSVGTSIISYSTASGCLATMLFTVDSLPTITPSSATICLGSTVTLAGSPTGGSWSTASANVSVGTSSGIVTGVAAGTADVTYTVASTGCSATATITVNALPLPDAPHGPVCSGDSITLTNPTPGGGTWSSASPIVTVNPTTGGVRTSTAGTAIVTFTSAATGCSIYDTLTINVGPTGISGLHTLCVGDSTLLISSPSGGFWSATGPSSTIVFVNPSTGMVHGLAQGTATVSYTLLSSGCAATFDMTVNPLPTPILVAPVCVGSTTIATSSPVGGVWSVTPPSAAFINPSTGALTGLSTLGGPFTTVTLTYTLPTGCSISAIDTIYALPTTIVGDTQICAGFSGTLSSTPAGGAWSSSFPPILTINSTTGIYTTAPGGGTVTVTYVDPHSCATSRVITVNPIPPAITGDSFLCRGDSDTLRDITTGGTWTSSAILVATIGSASGVITGVWTGTTPSTATITYTLPTGCYTTMVVTVNPVPSPITGTMQMCSGTCVSLSSVSTAGGGWTSYNPGVATATGTGGLSALVCGTNNTLLPDTATIQFTVTGTGCFVQTIVTVYPNPGPILGDDSVCQGSITTLSNAITGGTWSITSGTGSATIGATTGIVSAGIPGTVTVHYTVWPTGCTRDTILTIFAPPSPIVGDSVVCKDDSIFVSDPTPGGSFSVAPTAVLSITPSGIIHGLAAGTATITYTIASTGCFVTKVITVNGLPGAIVGPTRICLNDSAILYNATTPGGTWAANPTGIVTLTSLSALGDTVRIKGIIPGTVTLTYTLPTGCLTTGSFTIDTLPQPILGTAAMCLNDCVTLYNVTGITNNTGSWSWTNVTGVINVTPVPTSAYSTDSAVVCGLAPGTALITYTEPYHGCSVTRPVTVNPLPTVIIGPARVCEGFSDTLHNSTPGGHWTSSNTSIATVDTNGVVTGVHRGVVIITYTLNATGCFATAPFTVDSMPNVTVNHPVIKCRREIVTLTANGASTYFWNPSSGLSCTACQSPSANPSVTTTYTVTGVTPAGCSDTAVVTVVVDTLLNDIRIAGRDTICTGMCDTLVAIGFHGSLFSWVPPAGLSCTVCDTTIACPTGNAVYMAVAIDSFGCRDTASFHITVMPLPRMIYSPNPPFVCYGDSTQITVTDLNATSTYTTKFAWFPNVMISCDTCPSPYLFDTFSLVYRVTGISPFGCVDSIRIPVSVLKNSENTY